MSDTMCLPPDNQPNAMHYKPAVNERPQRQFYALNPARRDGLCFVYLQLILSFPVFPGRGNGNELPNRMRWQYGMQRPQQSNKVGKVKRLMCLDCGAFPLEQDSGALHQTNEQ